jgi:hypothetical protein
MSEIAEGPDCWESRTVRRLSRLFRIERAGGFERRAAPTVRRLIARRRGLIERLIASDLGRRPSRAARAARLDAALSDLAGEVRQSQEFAAIRLERLEAELRLRRGDGPATGIREGAGGHLLGSG